MVGAALRPTARPAPRRARPARLLVRSRRLRPLRREAPADRGRVGEGRRGRLARLGQPRRPALRPCARRGLPRWCQPVRRRADDRRRLGVDGVRLHRLPRLRHVPLQGVLRGVLRLRLQGPAGRLVGDVAVGGPGDLPQLGLSRPPPDLRRLPVCP
jgi:hypothetical protein